MKSWSPDDRNPIEISLKSMMDIKNPLNDALVQDCSISIINALEVLLSHIT